MVSYIRYIQPCILKKIKIFRTDVYQANIREGMKDKIMVETGNIALVAAIRYEEKASSADGANKTNGDFVEVAKGKSWPSLPKKKSERRLRLV